MSHVYRSENKNAANKNAANNNAVNNNAAKCTCSKKVDSTLSAGFGEGVYVSRLT